MSTINVANYSDGVTSIPSGYVLEGTAKVHWEYDQTVPTVRDSNNLSSITDSAAGRHVLNLTSSMSGIYYGVSTCCNSNGANDGVIYCLLDGTAKTASTTTLLMKDNASDFDNDFSLGSIHGSLA